MKDEFECVNNDVDSDIDDDINSNKKEIMLNETDYNQEELEVLQLKDNVFPRGLVKLEEIFDFNDVAKNPKYEPIGDDVEDCNIGTEENPKIVKLSKTLPPKEKQKYIELFK